MIEIRPIETHQIQDAKRVILCVARKIYHWHVPLDDLLIQFDEDGGFSDIDDVATQYSGRDGLFLVVLDEGNVVGTGAVRQFDGGVCELKRLWLLEDYQGQGIGFRLMQKLIAFAQENGYSKIRLETGHEQTRAIQFYLRLGFQFIENYSGKNNDYAMELAI